MIYRNLVVLYRQQVERLGPRPALCYKRHGMFRVISWDEYYRAVTAAASALVQSGVALGDRVCLLSENRVEWLMADLATLMAGAVIVPPHAPLTSEQIQFQIDHAAASWIFTSGGAQLEKIQKIRNQLKNIRGVICFDAANAGGDVQSWAAFLQEGRLALQKTGPELARREALLGADDLATLMYTSGTTGDPKGVMLTHGNLLSNSLAMIEAAPLAPDSLSLNWLPYSHIYARTVDHYARIAAGALVGLADSADTVVANLEDLQPTHITSVPRLYEKVLAAVASADPKETARGLRRIFGPKMESLSSGGAPLPIDVARAYHAAGLMLLQGYGLTESSPVISTNTKQAFKIETVGRPLSGVEVRIADDGEVMTRGPHVMKGYWKNAQGTAETIRDGWLHTGDLGMLDDDGYLSITGRKKDLLVLSNGKKIAPSQIENILLADSLLDQVVVCGEGKNYLTALLVPNWDKLAAALREENLELPGDDEERSAIPTFMPCSNESSTIVCHACRRRSG